jgi:hypothetical protein
MTRRTKKLSKTTNSFRRADESLTGELGDMAAPEAMLAMSNANLAHFKRVLEAAIHTAPIADVTVARKRARVFCLLCFINSSKKTTYGWMSQNTLFTNLSCSLISRVSTFQPLIKKKNAPKFQPGV